VRWPIRAIRVARSAVRKRPANATLWARAMPATASRSAASENTASTIAEWPAAIVRRAFVKAASISIGLLARSVSRRTLPVNARLPECLSHSAHNPKDALANIKASNADRDWDNAISSCGPIVPPCPPANDAFPVRRARIVAARLDTYRPSSPTASTWFRASQSIPC
jgi:hypothetical protein